MGAKEEGCIFVIRCSHPIPAHAFKWGWQLVGDSAPKALPPFLTQAFNFAKSRNSGNKRPRKSPWAMTWRPSCPAGSRWSTASRTTTPSWMITSGRTEGPCRGLPCSRCVRHAPKPGCQQPRSAPLIQELCFHTMLKTIRAALEAVHG